MLVSKLIKSLVSVKRFTQDPLTKSSAIACCFAAHALLSRRPAGSSRRPPRCHWVLGYTCWHVRCWCARPPTPCPLCPSRVPHTCFRAAPLAASALHAGAGAGAGAPCSIQRAVDVYFRSSCRATTAAPAPQHCQGNKTGQAADYRQRYDSATDRPVTVVCS